MIYISHELKAIYIHIPKCGGCYTRNILKKYYNFKTVNFKNKNHEDYCDNTKNYNVSKFNCVSINKKGILRYYYDNPVFNKLMNMDTDKWNSYYKFTFVRSPYKKIVSAYLYMVQSKVYRNNSIYDETDFYKTFIDFVNNKEKITNIGFFHGFITQYDHLLDCDNKLNINYIGNVDNLSYDLTNVLHLLGVKEIKHIESYDDKQNTSKHIIPFYEHYNETIFNEVNKFFDIDFKIFNLKKFENYNDFLFFFKKNDIFNEPKDELKHEIYLYKYNSSKLKNTTIELERLTKLLFQNMEIIHNIKDSDFSYQTHKNAINNLLKCQNEIINDYTTLRNINKIVNTETNIV